MNLTRTPWTALCTAAVLLTAAACTTASDGLSGASVPPQAPAGDAAPDTAVDAPIDAPVDTPIDAPADAAALGAGDAMSDTAAGSAVDPLAARPVATRSPRLILRFANPANPVDVIGALHNEGVEALWQQRAAWTAGGRVDERKALALTIAWLCQSKAKLPPLAPTTPTTGPTFPTDPCDPSWPARLQALPGQRTLPMAQIYALAGLTAAEQRTIDAILAEQAAGLASKADPSARIAAIIRLEAGLRGGGANPLGAGDAPADEAAAVDAVDAAAGITSSIDAADAITGSTESDGASAAPDGPGRPFPLPTMSPWPRPIIRLSAVARASLAYWWTEAAAPNPRWTLLASPAGAAGPTPTPKPRDWGKIGKADVAGAGAGGAVGGFWGSLIGAVLFSAVEGFTQ
ncbi:MAG: hypothetical protein IT332_07700 [Ardenticatenales bacterium]|nr:hypothetical protein [Ardenticatenales bacterium]